MIVCRTTLQIACCEPEVTTDGQETYDFITAYGFWLSCFRDAAVHGPLQVLFEHGGGGGRRDLEKAGYRIVVAADVREAKARTLDARLGHQCEGTATGRNRYHIPDHVPFVVPVNGPAILTRGIVVDDHQIVVD